MNQIATGPKEYQRYAVTRYAGWTLCGHERSWGSARASLHPRLYADTRFAGCDYMRSTTRYPETR